MDKVSVLYAQDGRYVAVADFAYVCDERDAAREDAETHRAACIGYQQERDAARQERDEARAALREMVDAAHTSFAASYPLARRLRERFDWLKEAEELLEKKLTDTS